MPKKLQKRCLNCSESKPRSVIKLPRREWLPSSVKNQRNAEKSLNKLKLKPALFRRQSSKVKLFTKNVSNTFLLPRPSLRSARKNKKP